MQKTAWLALENGETFEGIAFGDTEAEACGEVVFTTGMTGYQETLSDPSFRGQIITFTYPHIGNYGVNEFDMESDRIQAEGLIIKELSTAPSNWRSRQTLNDFLHEHGVIGIAGLDTRKLVRILRSEGAMRGIISARAESPQALVERARQLPAMDGLDLTGLVSTPASYRYEPAPAEPLLMQVDRNGLARDRFRVAALDFGIKRNILRRLHIHGCDVTVFPARTTAREILASEPDGIFLSNGPGDPAAVGYAMDTIRALAGKAPMFGICLGHQLIALAYGAKTYKLRFGHRGLNHPVQNLLNGAVEITSQNHGFAVDADTLPSELELTHVNLNDNTVSGLRHRDLPVFCVQYHPEASPGTHDSDYLFRQFTSAMAQSRKAPLAAQS